MQIVMVIGLIPIGFYVAGSLLPRQITAAEDRCRSQWNASPPISGQEIDMVYVAAQGVVGDLEECSFSWVEPTGGTAVAWVPKSDFQPPEDLHWDTTISPQDADNGFGLLIANDGQIPAED